MWGRCTDRENGWSWCPLGLVNNLGGTDSFQAQRTLIGLFIFTLNLRFLLTNKLELLSAGDIVPFVGYSIIKYNFSCFFLYKNEYNGNRLTILWLLCKPYLKVKIKLQMQSFVTFIVFVTIHGYHQTLCPTNKQSVHNFHDYHSNKFSLFLIINALINLLMCNTI